MYPVAFGFFGTEKLDN
jgi:hypothetical protein